MLDKPHCNQQSKLKQYGRIKMEKLQMVISNEIVEVDIKEYQGQRVVTLRDMDNLHRRNLGTASRNFQNSKKRFLEGEDYFVLQPSQKNEIHTFQIPNRGLTILTESGYLMLVKSFTDDLAWQVQRQLVKTYFKAKEIVAQQPQAPQTIEDILISALTSMKDMKQENAELKQAVRHLEVVVDNEIWLTENQKADIQATVKSRMGQLKSDHIDAHFQSIFSALNTYFNVPKYDKIPRKDFEQAIDFIHVWFPKRKETTSL
jgi:phage regulator Rha-like protein